MISVGDGVAVTGLKMTFGALVGVVEVLMIALGVAAPLTSAFASSWVASGPISTILLSAGR